MLCYCLISLTASYDDSDGATGTRGFLLSLMLLISNHFPSLLVSLGGGFKGIVHAVSLLLRWRQGFELKQGVMDTFSSWTAIPLVFFWLHSATASRGVLCLGVFPCLMPAVGYSRLMSLSRVASAASTLDSDSDVDRSHRLIYFVVNS